VLPSTAPKLYDVPFFSLSFRREGDKYAPVGLFAHYRFSPEKYFHAFAGAVSPSDVEKAVVDLKRRVDQVVRTVEKCSTMGSEACIHCPALFICGCRAPTHCRLAVAMYNDLLLGIHSAYSKQRPELILRSVTPADKYTLRSLWDELQREGHFSHEYPENMMMKYVHAYAKGAGMWVLTDAGSVSLGFLTLSVGGEIGIYLRADVRGKSLGKYMVAFVTGVARLQRKKEIFARTRNQLLMKILETQGFAPEEDDGG